MNRECYRCHKELVNPGRVDKADYVIAVDTRGVDVEPRLLHVKHTPDTLLKLDAKEEIDENDYERIDVTDEVPVIDEKHVRFEKANVEFVREKGGIICPDCFNPETDFVIWGVHKGQGRENP